MAEFILSGSRVDVGPPALVGRRAGHFWFPSLHPLGDGDVLCEVVLADDKAQGRWQAVLALSRDGGATWQEAGKPTTYGPGSVLQEPRRLLLMPYELWPLSPGDRRNAAAEGTIVSRRADGRLAMEPATVRFLGFPADLADYHEGELSLVTNGNTLALPDGLLLMTIYGKFAGDALYTNFAVVSADGGLTWQFRGIVAGGKDTPGAPEGPCESNSALLTDGRLLCIYRVGSGREYLFHRSLSADMGATWTAPEPLVDAWSVEPQLARLDNGLLLLSGGRTGLFFWVCADGEGRRWEQVNLAAHHNATVSDLAMRFPQALCEANDPQPAASTSYTGMLAVGPDEALICYDRLGNGWSGAPGPWGPEDAVFCVRIKTTPAA